MPELPDVTVYVEALQRRIIGQRLTRMRVAKPFVLRTFDPPAEEFIGRAAVEVRRVGKRIVIGFEGHRFGPAGATKSEATFFTASESKRGHS